MADKEIPKTFLKNALELLKELLIAAIGDIGMGVILKKYFEEHGGKQMAEQLKFKFSDEHRLKLLDYIEHMEHDDAREGLKQWYHEVHERNENGHPGEEDRWVLILGKLLYYCDTLKIDSKVIFNILGCIRDPKEREEALDFLEQDWFRQFMKRIKLAFKEFMPSKRTLRKLDKKVANSIDEFSRSLTWLRD